MTRYLIILLLCISSKGYASEKPELLKSTSEIVNRVFVSGTLAKAIKSEELLKLRFDGEAPRDDADPIYITGQHKLKI